MPAPLPPAREAPAALAGDGMTPFQAAWRSRWPILGFALVLTCLAAVVVGRLQPRFAASTAIVVDTRQMRVVNADSLLSNQAVDAALLRTRIEELRSFQIALGAAEQLGLERLRDHCIATRALDPWLERMRGPLEWIGLLDDRTPEEACRLAIEDAALFLLSAVTGVSDGRSSVIWVRAQTSDPQLSADIANSYAAAFVAIRRREMQRVAEQARAWLDSNAAQLRRQMDEASAAVERYREENRITPLNGGTLLDRRLQEMNADLSSATSELIQKRSTLEQLRAITQDSALPDANAALLSSTVAHALLVRMAETQRAQSDLRSRLGPAHPDVIAGEAQIERLRQQVRLETTRALGTVTTEVAALESRRAHLAREVEAMQIEVARQGAAETRLRELERDAALARTLHDTMLTRITQIQAEQSMQSADAYVAVQARPPETPVFPRRAMILAGVFLTGIGIGAAACIARLLVRPRQDDLQAIEGEVGIPVLGTFLAPPRRQSPQDVVVRDPVSPAAEAVHAILAGLPGLGRIHSAPQGRTVLVTSALAGEGKTSLCVALGRSAARAGLSAVIMECDLRRPAVLAAFGGALTEDRQQGGEAAAPPSPFTRPVADPSTGLHLVAVTRPVDNPHIVLAAPALTALLNRLRSRYDLVILDTPPVLAVADAARLAALADDVVLVAAWKQTPRDAVQAAIRILQRNGAAIAGIVFSKVRLRDLAWGRTSRAYHARLSRARQAHA